MPRLLLATIVLALAWGGPVTRAHAGPYSTTSSGDVTTVTDNSGWAATFTLGARTVTVRGPSRTLHEEGTARRVTTSTYVRLLPAAFTGEVDDKWLRRALADDSPDLLAVALQYVAGAPPLVDGSGTQYAGDASYGPLQDDGSRRLGADFNDYLGQSWTYGTRVDQPEAEEFRSLDCSGYARMVFGYRGGFPLALSPDGAGLPRTSADMATSAPGAEIVANTGTQAAVTSAIRPGDLLFFDASTRNGTEIDHVGIYLGPDDSGKARFISSRATPDGPTLGDTAAWSVISGTGYYASAFRSVRRI